MCSQCSKHVLTGYQHCKTGSKLKILLLSQHFWCWNLPHQTPRPLWGRKSWWWISLHALSRAGRGSTGTKGRPEWENVSVPAQIKHCPSQRRGAPVQSLHPESLAPSWVMSRQGFALLLWLPGWTPGSSGCYTILGRLEPTLWAQWIASLAVRFRVCLVLNRPESTVYETVSPALHHLLPPLLAHCLRSRLCPHQH